MKTYHVDIWCKGITEDPDPNSDEISNVDDARYYGLYFESEILGFDGDPKVLGKEVKSNNSSCRVQVWHTPNCREFEQGVMTDVLRFVDYDSKYHETQKEPCYGK